MVPIATDAASGFRVTVDQLEAAVDAQDEARLEQMLGAILARHGVRLNIEVLQRDSDLGTSLGLPGPPQRGVTGRLDRTLSRLEEVLADQGRRHR